jgi:hypothetical protein
LFRRRSSFVVVVVVRGAVLLSIATIKSDEEAKICRATFV